MTMKGYPMTETNNLGFIETSPLRLITLTGQLFPKLSCEPRG